MWSDVDVRVLVEVGVVVVGIVGTGWLGLVSRPGETMMGGMSAGWGDVSYGVLTDVGVLVIDLVVLVDLVGTGWFGLVLRPCGTLLVLVCGVVVVHLWCLGRSAILVLGEIFIVCIFWKTVCLDWCLFRGGVVEGM